jgi:hypothetical protein
MGPLACGLGVSGQISGLASQELPNQRRLQNARARSAVPRRASRTRTAELLTRTTGTRVTRSLERDAFSDSGEPVQGVQHAILPHWSERRAVPAGSPPPGTLPCDQCCVSFLLMIAMRLADSRALADFGRTTVSTPFLNEASARSSFSSKGSAMLRSNRP